MKLFFTDLDGTILNTEKEISPGNRAAVAEALAAGHKVIVATGRPLSSAIRQAKRLGLGGEGCLLIAYNGGIIYDIAAGTKSVIPGPEGKMVRDFALGAARDNY